MSITHLHLHGSHRDVLSPPELKYSPEVNPGDRQDGYRVDVLHDGAFRRDSRLRARLLQLAAPSYVDPTTLLDKSLRACDTLYLLRDSDDRILSFFLVGHDLLDIGEERPVPAAFLAFNAVSAEVKSSALVKRVWAQWLSDEVEYEIRTGQRVVLWGTTAAPTIYLTAMAFLDDTNPRPDGSYTPRSEALAGVLREKLGAGAPAEDDHPFIARGVAVNTRYSPDEVERVERIVRRRGFRLFSELGIDERQGDRVIFVSYVPPPHRLRVRLPAASEAHVDVALEKAA